MANEYRLGQIAAGGLLLGGLLGIAGCFAPTAPLRGLAWGIDGVGLIVASALLTARYVRHDNDLAAAGFLTFAIGEGLVYAGSAMELMASVPTFGAGVALWAAALVMISAARVFPPWLCILGALAALPLAVVAVRIFLGELLSPLATPLPFFAYPPFVATLLGWAACLAVAPPSRPLPR